MTAVALARISHRVSSRGRRDTALSGVFEQEARPQRAIGGICGLNSRRLGDLARPDAPGADPHVLRSTVDHRPNALEIGQPAPLAHIVGVGDFASAHRALAADFTSLRHRRNPPRNPHKGVEFNSTGGAVLQVSGSLIPPKIVHHGEFCGTNTLH